MNLLNGCRPRNTVFDRVVTVFGTIETFTLLLQFNSYRRYKQKAVCTNGSDKTGLTGELFRNKLKAVLEHHKFWRFRCGPF